MIEDRTVKPRPASAFPCAVERRPVVQLQPLQPVLRVQRFLDAVHLRGQVVVVLAFHHAFKRVKFRFQVDRIIDIAVRRALLAGFASNVRHAAVLRITDHDKPVCVAAEVDAVAVPRCEIADAFLGQRNALGIGYMDHTNGSNVARSPQLEQPPSGRSWSGPPLSHVR